MTNNKDIFFGWYTNKVEGGFKFTVKKNISIDPPVNGRYVSTSIEKTGIEPTRARAKSKAVRWIRYFKSELNKVA